MSKVMKKLLALLTIIGLFVGIVGVPQKSEAVHSYSYPATTTYIEFLNSKGEELPITMGLEATYVKAKGPGEFGGYYPTTIVSTAPASITKTAGKNHFAINIPAFNYTTPTNSSYTEYLANLRTTPLKYMKEMRYLPPLGSSLPQLSYINHWSIRENGSTNSGSYNQGMYSFYTKQSDDSYILTDAGSSTINLGGFDSYFNSRQVRSDSTGTAGAFIAYGLDGDTMRFYIIFYQVKEYFEDQTGASIPAPTGYKNGNVVDITNQPFAYQMAGHSSLPQTYTDSGFIYTYEGWYKGVGNKASMNTTYPPTINFNATLSEAQNEVHIVYNKKALRIVNEEYIDTSSGTIESSWNNLGQTFADGDTFAQTPAATKTDTSGTDWEYQGWKLDSEPMSAMRPSTTPVSVLIDANKNIQYVYKKTEHTITEKWVDRSDGTTLVPMTGNPATNSIDDNDHFTGSATATITDSGGGIWDFIGWENVTDDPGNVIPSPAYAVNNIKGNKEIRYHYQARNTTATLDLIPTPQVVDSGNSVAWASRVTNTGTSALNNLTLKATSNWASGLTHPTQVTVTPSIGAPQNFTVGAGDWLTGVNLTGINIPTGQYADITFTDTATGAVNQVLPAEIELDGNMATSLKAENFVRIDDPNEPNLKPTGNAGLINIPKFDFGQTEVKPFAQKKGLDASAYQGTYNPYIRFYDKESPVMAQGDLTVKLGQFTSGSKTLPTTTSITLANGTLNEVQNFNKPNESINPIIWSMPTITIPSDGTSQLLSTVGQGVFQLDYAFNDVELNLMAHSGVAGFSYKATMDWTYTNSI